LLWACGAWKWGTTCTDCVEGHSIWRANNIRKAWKKWLGDIEQRLGDSTYTTEEMATAV